MAERGMNPFVRVFVRFLQSLKPSSFRPPRGELVGSDHLGNKYFEIAADPSKGKRKPVRYFESANKIAEHVPDGVPPLWNAWLRMQRDDPPSQEEQGRNLQRLAILEAKKAAEKAPETPSFPRDSAFPKFPEYEDVPGSKYKPS